jgi:F0F1-type ATP synthase membrane subunit c/vacuolar-type H+-ATPase subunit K
VAALAIVAETEMACGWIVAAIARALIAMERVQAIGATPKLLNLLFSKVVVAILNDHRWLFSHYKNFQ